MAEQSLFYLQMTQIKKLLVKAFKIKLNAEGARINKGSMLIFKVNKLSVNLG